MSVTYKPCQCDEHKRDPRPLTSLILECWQRDSFKRPYNHLYLNKKFFEDRLQRQFNTEDYGIIIKFLEARPKIQKFRFSNFRLPINCKTELHRKFGRTLQQRSEVELINLKFPVIFFKNLLEEPTLTRIRILRLSGTVISETIAHLLRCFLLWNSYIVYLDVGYCNLTERSFSLIADGVYNSTSVTAFNMNRLVLHDKCDTMDTGHVSFVIAQLIWKNQLTELHIRNVPINSHDIIPIAEYVGETKSILKYLDLGTNSLSADGVEVLFKAIVISKSLIGLDLSHNSIGNDGGEIIGYMLPSTKIKYLSIAFNGIDFSGMHLLISTVKKSSQLKILNLFGNKYNSETTHSLKRQLSGKTLLVDDLDVDVVFDSETNEFYWTPQIKLPPIFGEHVNRFNLLQ